MAARRAAIIFSLMQSTGRTSPVSVISPVIAVSARTGIRLYAEAMAAIMATPADRPSLGGPLFLRARGSSG
jgi:hypothetical protein